MSGGPLDSRPVRVLCPSWVEGGHDRAYTEYLLAGLQALGVAAQLHAGPGLQAFPSPQAFPARSARPAARAEARLWPPVRARMEVLRFARLQALCARAFSRDGAARWWVHTADWRTARAVLRAWRSRPNGELSLLLRYDHYDDPAARALAAEVLALGARPDVRLLSDSLDLIAAFARLHPVPVAPVPLPTPLAPRARAGAPVFAVLGALRPQKGARRTAGLVTRLLEAAPDATAVVQTRLHPDDRRDAPDAEPLAALRAEPRVELVEDYLAEADFLALIRRTHVLILDYDPWIYRASTSGIFATGVASGAAALCPASGWMARESGRRGLARVFPGDLDDPGQLAAHARQAAAAALQPVEAPLLRWAAEGDITTFAEAWLRSGPSL